MQHIVIIGAGHAGLTLARELRSKDTDIRITLLSREPIQAYYKPNLSKALSSGKSIEALIQKNKECLENELKASLIELAEVTGISPMEQTCSYRYLHTEVSTVKTLHYDKLVLATGASPIELPKAVIGESNILHINNLEHYRLFREKLNGIKSVAIIGAGYIGCELASDLSATGFQVSVIDKGLWPLSRALPEALGSVIKKQLSEDQHIQWFLGNSVERIEQDNGFLLHLTKHLPIQTDLVICAIGLQANKQLAQLAGARTHIGIEVNKLSETSVPNIYALGDCAEYSGQLMPFIAPITTAAKALANTLCNQATPLFLAANAVPVKLANCPLVICPSGDTQGIWQVKGSGKDLEALFINNLGELTGFALTGESTKNKVELLKRCQARFPLSTAHQLAS